MIRVALQIAIAWTGVATVTCGFFWILVRAFVRAFGRRVSEIAHHNADTLSTPAHSDRAVA